MRFLCVAFNIVTLFSRLLTAMGMLHVLLTAIVVLNMLHLVNLVLCLTCLAEILRQWQCGVKCFDEAELTCLIRARKSVAEA